MQSEPALILAGIAAAITSAVHYISPDAVVDPAIISAASIILLGFLIRRGVVSPAAHDQARRDAHAEGMRMGQRNDGAAGDV